jgi:hypothetical protein
MLLCAFLYLWFVISTSQGKGGQVCKSAKGGVRYVPGGCIKGRLMTCDVRVEVPSHY